MEQGLSIMVPAFNEEDNLENTVREIEAGLSGKVKDYEIIIFNDGSTDKTGEIAESLAKKDKRLRIVHNNPNKGMGYCYITGQKLARFEYYMFIPGDNQMPAKGLGILTSRIGEADMIVPYVTNMNIRPILRQWISQIFTIILNLLFGFRMTYYNASVIHKTQLLRGVPQNPNSGHAYQAEILIRLLKAGASYVEVGYPMTERSAGKTTALKWKNIKRVIGTLVPLFWEMQILKKPPIHRQAQKNLKGSH